MKYLIVFVVFALLQLAYAEHDTWLEMCNVMDKIRGTVKFNTNYFSYIDPNSVNGKEARRAGAITNVGNVENVVRSWGLPEDAVQRFKMIAFANSVVFQKFELIIPARVHGGTSIATMDELVGIAINQNGQIKMMYVWGVGSGKLIGQYDTIKTHKCSSFLGIKHSCGNKDTYVPRGFSLEEIGVITDALRIFAFSNAQSQAVFSKTDVLPIRQFVKHINATVPKEDPNVVPLDDWRPAPVDDGTPSDPSDPLDGFEDFPFEEVDAIWVENSTEYTETSVNLHNQSANTTNVFSKKRNTNGIVEFVKSFFGNFDSTLKTIQDLKPKASAEIVNSFMGPQSGLNTLKTLCSAQQFVGMDPSYLVEFTESLMTILGIPDARSEDFVNLLSEIKAMEPLSIVHFQFLYDKSANGKCKFASVLVEKRSDNKLNWLVADFAAEFEFLPNAFLVSKSSSVDGESTNFEVVPKTLNEYDLQFVQNWMQVIIFKRYSDLLKLEFPNSNL